MRVLSVGAKGAYKESGVSERKIPSNQAKPPCPFQPIVDPSASTGAFATPNTAAAPTVPGTLSVPQYQAPHNHANSHKRKAGTLNTNAPITNDAKKMRTTPNGIIRCNR
ncbi:hypothetical protein EST38_g2622 [Candolleomyces aberdarensis]|uniref:Uncharacterized protein n=1 Tax=Candolleomyces aberdarensis TaxID=2316362 RepID=A0A4Q2DU71_9AGAR|nr:hypothetical protein EST38_g2622 [Candolleomyces aberdarensis]